ncbi:hypothetical protein [Streptodolium elevatio]
MYGTSARSSGMYATFARGVPLAHDARSRTLSVPLILHHGDGTAVDASALRLGGTDTEFLHAALTRLLNGAEVSPTPPRDAQEHPPHA